MTSRELFAVAIGVLAVSFISMAVVAILANFMGELAYLLVGLCLLAAAGFIRGSGPTHV